MELNKIRDIESRIAEIRYKLEVIESLLKDTEIKIGELKEPEKMKNEIKFYCPSCGNEAYYDAGRSVLICEKCGEFKIEWLSYNFAINKRGKCPKCGSVLIDQETSEDTTNWFHCAKCGCWYNEKGEIDQEEVG